MVENKYRGNIDHTTVHAVYRDERPPEPASTVDRSKNVLLQDVVSIVLNMQMGDKTVKEMVERIAQKPLPLTERKDQVYTETQELAGYKTFYPVEGHRQAIIKIVRANHPGLVEDILDIAKGYKLEPTETETVMSAPKRAQMSTEGMSLLTIQYPPQLAIDSCNVTDLAKRLTKSIYTQLPATQVEAVKIAAEHGFPPVSGNWRS